MLSEFSRKKLINLSKIKLISFITFIVAIIVVFLSYLCSPFTCRDHDDLNFR